MSEEPLYTGKTLRIVDDKTKEVLVTTWTGDRQKIVQVPIDTQYYSPDAMVRDDNMAEVLEENRKLKSARIEGLRVVINFLNSINVPYWISDGTLLAAYRDNGVMIERDVDCDVSIMENDLPKVWENRHLLPKEYRLNTTSCGTDWSEPENLYGKFVLIPGKNMAKKFSIHDTRDYSSIVHHTLPPEIDIYTFRECEDGIIQSNYAKISQHIHLRKWQKDWIFPLKEMPFEGITCLGPNDPKQYLEELFGYIGHNAVWNTETKKYEPKK